MIHNDILQFLSTQGERGNQIVLWLEKRQPEDVELGQVEHVIDYMLSDKAPKRTERATWEQMVKNTEKWTKSLAKKGKNSGEETEEDIKIILDYGDGFKIVQLISPKSYEREGFLMSHCVASYAEKGVDVYSLRDAENMPHCTIEKDQQIKGKGNGSIHPKYIDYIVRFLEFSGMEVRDSEMENLGYQKVPQEYVGNSLYRGLYIHTSEKIIPREGFIIFRKNEKNEFLKYNGKLKSVYLGSLYLRGYTHPLPAGFTHCGGSLDLEGYTHPLPAGFTHCGGYLDLEGYTHPLPAGFTHCGGYLDLEGYTHPLPAGFTHCGGSLYLRGYTHPLPAGFTHCGGSLYLEGYTHPLPAGFTENYNNNN